MGGVDERNSTNPTSHVARTADEIVSFCQTHRRSDDDQTLRVPITYVNISEQYGLDSLKSFLAPMMEHLDVEVRFTDSNWWPNVTTPRLLTDQD